MKYLLLVSLIFLTSCLDYSKNQKNSIEKLNIGHMHNPKEKDA
jgi:hypothetical protein